MTTQNYLKKELKDYYLEMVSSVAIFKLRPSTSIISALEDAVRIFEESKKAITSKQYDYLDQRNIEFDKDFTNFTKKVNELKEKLAMLIEENFVTVWETAQGIRFLPRFEMVK